jgi:anaerobic selenocysteine-containing dehydrogenase
VDGHNSHTNVCSSSGRAGYQYWMGFDRPSADFANANVILLISSHLETGHYFNPHAQRVIDGKERGAKLIVVDTRLSNTATHADFWLATQPGSEAALMLAIANHLIQTGRYNREFVRRWWNWEEYLAHERPDVAPTFESFERVLRELYAEYTPEFAAREAGLTADTVRAVAETVAGAGTRLATHTWRSAAAGNEGGWQVSRTLFLLNALLGAVGTEGGTYPNGWNKFVPRPIYTPPHPPAWNELTWPREYPLAMNELSFLLPHFLAQGRGRLEVYFTRVYNPVWTNPDGFMWIEVLKDESKIGLHVALTPTWNETAAFADYVLPMGLGPERHDLHSYETHDAEWIAFRQPVIKAARERWGETFGADGSPADTRAVNPGEVWEENEFWIDLTWRIDPDGSLGIRRWVESKARPGEKLPIDEYYGWIFEHSVPGLAEKAAAEGLTPLAYMRRYGAFEIRRRIGQRHEEEVPASELEDVREGRFGRVYTRTAAEPAKNLVPTPTPDPDREGRRAVGVRVDGNGNGAGVTGGAGGNGKPDGLIRRGFPTPSGRLEFYSRTLAEWGWAECAIPTYLRSHVHPDKLAPGERVLISTFRLPVHVHTRSQNSKWLNEIAHSNPLWIHPRDAAEMQLATGDLVRVETAIGHFVLKAWVTEGIRPGIVACSHHMGRWRISGQESVSSRQIAAAVSLKADGTRWVLRREKGAGPYPSSDPDTMRINWNEVGVHQNLTFPVHPDPVSGQHCWHQAVRVRRAEAGDRPGDVMVDTAKSMAIYEEWLARARAAERHSPDGTRRPYWLLRPLKPGREVYRLPESSGKR